MTILITGGTSGLGESIVKKLAADPAAQVWFTYASSAEKAASLTTSFPNTRAIQCDFREQPSVDALVEQIGTIGPDVLINNAFVTFPKVHFHKADPAQFEAGFRYNILPVIRITGECIRQFRSRKFGKIINITTSALLNKPPIGWSDYVAGKAYILALSKSWATENARFNITSNSISPAFMRTSFTSDMDERLVEEMTKAHPLKALLEPAEVADAVAWFVGCSQQVNGTHFVMNSGSDIV